MIRDESMIREVTGEDDYLICSEYEKRADQLSGKHPDFVCFYHEMTGKFYFAWMDSSWNVLLRSEGYPTIPARDHGIETVIRNRSHRDHFKLLESHDIYFLVLTAVNNQEIGRSCPKKTIEEAWALISQEKNQTKIPVIEHVIHINKNNNMNEQLSDVLLSQDNRIKDTYLPCREYRGHHINDKLNHVSLFMHSNGRYYFVIYHLDGAVRLKSEGFNTAEDRDVELSGVLKSIEIPERYFYLEELGYLIKILKDQTGREVARSCPEKI
ncbi:MAG: YegP family protein [Saprospiraceae bacterium]|nr:YegP family protein [Candidatus Vicinibacter affinis]